MLASRVLTLVAGTVWNPTQREAAGKISAISLCNTCATVGFWWGHLIQTRTGIDRSWKKITDTDTSHVEVELVKWSVSMSSFQVKSHQQEYVHCRYALSRDTTARPTVRGFALRQPSVVARQKIAHTQNCQRRCEREVISLRVRREIAETKILLTNAAM